LHHGAEAPGLGMGGYVTLLHTSVYDTCMAQVSYIDEVSYNCHIRLGIEASVAEPHMRSANVVTRAGGARDHKPNFAASTQRSLDAGPRASD
jgi:hypothetical protein